MLFLLVFTSYFIKIVRHNISKCVSLCIINDIMLTNHKNEATM